jgi:hypothetical protein
MWQSSPTFRRQCARIGQAQAELDVEVRDQPTSRMSGVRAWTDIEARGRHGHTAIVYLKVEYQQQVVELIGHEMEHLLEWLDGVNLASGSHGHAVKDAGDGAFETVRATRVGRQVALEVARETVPADADARTQAALFARNQGARR